MLQHVVGTADLLKQIQILPSKIYRFVSSLGVTCKHSSKQTKQRTQSFTWFGRSLHPWDLVQEKTFHYEQHSWYNYKARNKHQLWKTPFVITLQFLLSGCSSFIHSWFAPRNSYGLPEHLSSTRRWSHASVFVYTANDNNKFRKTEQKKWMF